MRGRSSRRLIGRLRMAARALRYGICRRPRNPGSPGTILVLHHLLLGDTLMLAALFKELRSRWPAARIVTTCAPAILPLFAGRPWQVDAVAFDPRQPDTLDGLFALCRGGVDLALLPGENRYALLAHACGAQWIRGLAGDHPAWKNALCDELLPWPQQSCALPEIFATLADAGVPARYQRGEWSVQAVSVTPSCIPDLRSAVLHVGAGNPLRCWPADAWRAVADGLADRGLQPVWSCGPGEQGLVHAVDPEGCYETRLAGRLDLVGLWQLLTRASILVCLDSGVAHMAKLAGCPTVCIFGQGSANLFGAGDFFREMPFVSLIEDDVPCRDQRQLFGRKLPWVRRCARRPGECLDPVCIKAITPSAVLEACSQLLGAMPEASEGDHSYKRG